MTHLSDELIDLAAQGAALSPNASEHLYVCAECRAQVSGIQALRERMAALPRSVEPRGDGWRGVRQAINARRVRRRVFTGSAVFALAAALLFAVVRVTGTPGDSPPAAELTELRAVALPAVVDAMAANLTVYDAALTELEQHAASERENDELRQRIDDLRRKRSALLRQASSS